jgi:hypothetical protein
MGLTDDIGQTTGICRVCGERVVVSSQRRVIRHGDCSGAGQPPDDWHMLADDFQAVATDLAIALGKVVDSVDINVANRTVQVNATDEQAKQLLKAIKRRYRRAFWRGVLS